MSQRGPRPLRHGLNRLLSALGMPSADVLSALSTRWPELVGPTLAPHCRPSRLVNRHLTVEVSDAAWAMQLRLRTGELLERLTAELGEGAVQSIRLRMSAQITAENRRRGPQTR